jgi:hypothetical protein
MLREKDSFLGPEWSKAECLLLAELGLKRTSGNWTAAASTRIIRYQFWLKLSGQWRIDDEPSEQSASTMTMGGTGSNANGPVNNDYQFVMPGLTRYPPSSSLDAKVDAGSTMS